MARLITEWSTKDPILAETLKTIAAFPELSVERLELEAALHTWQASYLHQQIGRLRGVQSRRRFRPPSEVADRG